jgi:mono/diheme cytochrome c family protein
MRPNWIAAGVLAAIFFAPLTSNYPTRAQGVKIQFHETRVSPSDLELAGDVAGVPRGEMRDLTREDLLAASQAMTISPDDGNFKATTKVRAVGLEELARALGVPATDMVIAVCKDKYRGHYTRSYIATHHPLLVIELNDTALSDLPTESGAYDAGPYLIAHASFPRTSKDPAENDEPQIPWGVIRLEFRDEKTVFGAIAPRGPHANDANVLAGNRIAQQNCFRCHNSGGEGGRKSGVSWTALGALAAGSPEFLTEYVRDPASKNPRTQMAASPEYDDATMHALIEYFSTFAPSEAR